MKKKNKQQKLNTLTGKLDSQKQNSLLNYCSENVFDARKKLHCFQRAADLDAAPPAGCNVNYTEINGFPVKSLCYYVFTHLLLHCIMDNDG